MAASHSSAPPLSRLGSLPLEILRELCEHLAAGASRRRSIFAFSMTSKICCAAADTQRFKTIHIKVNSQQQLQLETATWMDILRNYNRTVHVRRIKILGQMFSETAIRDATDQTDQEALPYSLFSRTQEGAFNSNDPFFQPDPLFFNPVSVSAITQEQKATNNKGWQPLKQFLLAFQGLQHLVWAAFDQVPRYILDAVHGHPSGPLLHVHIFYLRSLFQNPHEPTEMDPDEYALATSPRLFSIVANRAHTFEWTNKIDYNGDAVLQMVLGAAPSLRSAHIGYSSVNRFPELLEKKDLSRPPWTRFLKARNDNPLQSKGTLTNLAFRGTASIVPELLQGWYSCTEFSKLRSLDLSITIKATTLLALIDMARAGVFECLRQLSLHSFIEDQAKEIHEKQTIPLSRLKEATKANFLAALRPLESIRVFRCERERDGLASGLANHAASLQKLHILAFPGQTFPDVEILRETCPNIRDLHLLIRRTCGDEREVRLYQALGAFPKLTNLALCLDLTNYELFTSIRKSVEFALRNSAMDADLARAIFRVVFTANQTAQAGTSPSFQNLILRLDGQDARHELNSINFLQGWVARSWECERMYADFSSDDVLTREIGKDERERIVYKLNGGENFASFNDRVYYKGAWEALWPEAMLRTDWYNGWHSFPLWQDNRSIE